MPRINPPHLYTVCAFFMLATRFLFPNYQLENNWFLVSLGFALLLSGLLLIVKINRNFAKKNLEINTFKKPKGFMTNGVFSYSRNPIYLSFVISLIGLFLVVQNLVSIIIILVFFLKANFVYIPLEEKNMKEIFGKKYLDYKLKVRRWI